VLNEDGTFAKKVTVGQDDDSGTGIERGILPTSNEPTVMVVPSHETTVERLGTEIPPIVVVVSTGFSVVPVPDIHLEPTDILNSQSEVMLTADVSSRTHLNPDLTAPVATLLVVPTSTGVVTVPIQVIVLVDEFGRDTCVINEVCELIEAMPHP